MQDAIQFIFYKNRNRSRIAVSGFVLLAMTKRAVFGNILMRFGRRFFRFALAAQPCNTAGCKTGTEQGEGNT